MNTETLTILIYKRENQMMEKVIRFEIPLDASEERIKGICDRLVKGWEIDSKSVGPHYCTWITPSGKLGIQ